MPLIIKSSKNRTQSWAGSVAEHGGPSPSLRPQMQVQTLPGPPEEATVLLPTEMGQGPPGTTISPTLAFFLL